jgi:hypothetical protein
MQRGGAAPPANPPPETRPGLSVLLLCFWIIGLRYILLLFIWRLRCSYLAPLLPRPRRVRQQPGLSALLLFFLLLFFWRLRCSYLAPLLPRPRRVRRPTRTGGVPPPWPPPGERIAGEDAGEREGTTRLTFVKTYPDFEVEDLPESGKAMPVLVSFPPFSSPLLRWPRRAPVPAQVSARGAGGPGRGPRLFDAAGGVGPGFQGAPGTPRAKEGARGAPGAANPGPNPRRRIRRGPRPVPPSPARLFLGPGPGRGGAVGAVGWWLWRRSGSGLSWCVGRSCLVVVAGVAVGPVFRVWSVLGSCAVVAWLVRPGVGPVFGCVCRAGVVSVGVVWVWVSGWCVSGVVAGGSGRVVAGVGGSGWVVSGSGLSWWCSVIPVRSGRTPAARGRAAGKGTDRA